MKRWLAPAVSALVIAGCKAPPSRPVASPASRTVEQLAVAIAADAKRSDGETDSKIRDQLAADAASNAQACQALAPQAAACLYYAAVALGLKARAHPLAANESLKAMLDTLSKADAADPEYDQAGPARVKALVLIKAPSWPLGPGDLQTGLASARRAVSLAPEFPPNILALAEALAKSGDTQGADLSYQHARDMAKALPPSADRDDWLREADQGLRN